MGYIGRCCCEGYVFQATYPGIGCRNHRVWVQNRVSFSSKQISWLKKVHVVQKRETRNLFLSLISRSNASASEISGKQQLQNSHIFVQRFWEFSIHYKVQGNKIQPISELGLVQGQGFWVPVAHPHSNIPKVPPSGFEYKK